MRFRLFGIPVELQLGFLLMAGALGMPLLQQEQKGAILVWMAVVFVSVLVHELGHALAIIRLGGEPAIVLWALGGITGMQRPIDATRLQRVGVAMAGPGAGFALAGVIYLVLKLFPSLSGGAPVYVGLALEMMLEVNVGWGIFNLIPVMPFDGGHVLLEAFGPQRLKTAGLVSLIIGMAIAALFLVWNQIWITFIVGLGALQSYWRLRSLPAGASGPTAGPPARPHAQAEPEEPPSPALAAELQRAQSALHDERYAEASEAAEQLLARRLPRPMALQAAQVLAWARLLLGHPDEAAKVLARIDDSEEVDKALGAAVLRAVGRKDVARALLESARGAGDDRKEIVGPLIQILIEAGEIARAAAIALDIVDTLSADDVRQMAEIAFKPGSYQWSSRLREALFERTGAPDDAYDAARARALEGDRVGAAAMLRRAVAAGFADAARAWSDAALESLRTAGELDALLPKPAEP